MKNYKPLILLLISLFIVAGCATTKSETNNGADLTIYTSIYPIQYAVERIGGDSVDAESVYPPGVDAHTYEPSSKEMASIAEGDAFIYLGAGMEGFAETAAQALDSQDAALVEIGANEELFHMDTNDHDTHDHGDGDHHDEEYTHEQEENETHHHHDHNPHIWLDPERMMDMASIIKDKLIELNPESSEQYTKNFNVLKDDLLALDQQFQETLESKENKKILVSHAAYGYWEERYGIEQIAISGLSSSDEPSQKELTNIIDQAEEHNLDYVLFEQNSSDRISEIIQDQVGAQSLQIHNLSVLTEGDIENGEDYLSLMKHNLDILDQATE
ncbi:zinc transport system substrate-binding protein [Lentibacillus halodurans]|uniref:Zinc transport system substrate-binding protein n=1 Tax=Lentibacillus halodurans TaxID=237679 RepID=A0A1I0WQ32_9BACI|nr:zinc ABC transporter substrate-binding protein [Lentibacillus halodurans]SFA90298.1 zinc transport system substrate-binding protein [Lentibacillus halodurans]